MLAKTVLRAPFDGVVSDRKASVGDTAQVGKELSMECDGTAQLTWRVLNDATPEERPQLWEQMAQIWPDYDNYQQRTDREIPIGIKVILIRHSARIEILEARVDSLIAEERKRR